MKIIWENSDFNTEVSLCGVVVNSGEETEHHMIGYMGGAFDSEAKYVLVSLRDGMVQGPWTVNEMAKELNDGKYLPVIRPIKVEESMKQIRDSL